MTKGGNNGEGAVIGKNMKHGALDRTRKDNNRCKNNEKGGGGG